MTQADFHALVRKFDSLRILVVGDLMLDEYVWGDVQRVSPEAPVPVVEIRKRTYVPGGAANTAANVVGLGGTALVAGVVGDDDSARTLRDVLQESGVITDGFVTDAQRPTTTKSRVIAHNQQIVRMDSEVRAELPKPLYHEMLITIEKQIASCDACILSDYNKGVLTEALAQSVIDFASRAGIPVIVDPKGTDYGLYRGATVIKPNLLEVEQATRLPVTTNDEVVKAGNHLMGIAKDSCILMTRGADGMSIFQPNQDVVHIPTMARTVFDVTGAGDTVVSTLAMAMAAGATLLEGAHLANRAASIAVGKMGTAAVPLHELKANLQDGKEY